MLRAFSILALLVATNVYADTIHCQAFLFGRLTYIVDLNRQLPPSPSYLKISTPGGWVAEGIPTKRGRGDTSYYLALGDGVGFEFAVAEGDRDMAVCDKANQCFRCL